MPIVTLKPKSEELIQTPGKFLSVVNTDGQFVIAAHRLGEVAGIMGRTFNMHDFTEVMFKNETNAQIVVEYESANIEVTGTGSGAVRIENKPTIQRIEEAIQVDAQATVENGTVTTQSHNALSELVDINVPASSKVQILAAAATDKRTVILQVISDSQTRLRVGSTTVAQGRGLVLDGSTDAIASLEFECTAALYVFNESPAAAKVAVMVGSR